MQRRAQRWPSSESYLGTLRVDIVSGVSAYTSFIVSFQRLHIPACLSDLLLFGTSYVGRSLVGFVLWVLGNLESGTSGVGDPESLPPRQLLAVAPVLATPAGVDHSLGPTKQRSRVHPIFLLKRK